jgi:hypothetical protein
MDDLVGYDIYMEGAHRDTYTTGKFIELRISDMKRRDLHKETSYNMTVNALVCTDNYKDLYEINDMVGAVLQAFRSTIQLIKLGDSGEDTGDVIGCMLLKADAQGESTHVYNYGKLDPSLNIQQSSVEGQYEIILNN